MDRRELLKTAGLVAGAVATSGIAGGANAAECCSEGKPKPCFKNEDFYGADGKFDLEKAKDAIIALCQFHGYPVFPALRENLWISDYGIGQFAKLGLAAVMFVNDVEDKYMLMDIFLLPGQMLPEHWHVEGEGNPAKREGWLVRWGLSHIVGIGESNLSKDVVIPDFHCGGAATTKHEIAATPGTFVKLSKVETRHWQYAGPEGAIITEVANVHTNSAVRHSDPKLNEYFLSH
jgi:D-lyxose ketol-isomerase